MVGGDYGSRRKFSHQMRHFCCGLAPQNRFQRTGNLLTMQPPYAPENVVTSFSVKRHARVGRFVFVLMTLISLFGLLCQNGKSVAPQRRRVVIACLCHRCLVWLSSWISSRTSNSQTYGVCRCSRLLLRYVITPPTTGLACIQQRSCSFLRLLLLLPSKHGLNIGLTFSSDAPHLLIPRRSERCFRRLRHRINAQTQGNTHGGLSTSLLLPLAVMQIFYTEPGYS